MKLYVVVFALLAGVNALPKVEVENAIRDGQGRIITDTIASVIELVSQAIVDRGLDPLIIESQDLDYALPVPTIFNLHAYARDVLFRGLSNIVINQLNLNLITMRATYNIGLPEILLNVVDSELDANFFGKNINSRYSGRLVLQNIVTTGDIRLNLGIISGISIREIDLTISIGRIDSQVNLRIQDVDFSNAVNTLLGVTIPTTLKNYETDINSLLTIVGKDIIESML